MKISQILLLLSTVLWTLPSGAVPPIVQLKQGALSGVMNPANGVTAYKGIPFAAPPIGQLRWRPPQPAHSWKGVRQAQHFSNQCMQEPIFDDMLFRSTGVSEDCLYLNVWQPAAESDKKHPVLVYFYGGGFVAGDGSEPRYDGESMASKDIVVVTVNYRLGVFGLLAHPDLSKESDYAGSGNYTFMDQIAALKWVHDNIAAFGGDPNRITIGGESAGAMAVSVMMASPLSREFIHAAIGQSGSILGPTLAAISLNEAEGVGSQLAKALGNDAPLSLVQLRKLPALELLSQATAAGYQWFMPSIDGHVLPEPAIQIYAKNQHAQVPLLAGINSQEAAFDDILGETPPTVTNYKNALMFLYPNQHQTVFELYPAKTPEQVKDAAQALAGDRFLGFSTWNWMDFANRENSQPGFYYYYDRVRPLPKVKRKSQGKLARGAVHSAEIEYALGNLTVHNAYQWQTEDHQISTLMQKYFANFIKFGDPNGPELPIWPDFSTNKQMIIGEKPRSEDMTPLRARYLFHRHHFASQSSDQ